MAAAKAGQAPPDGPDQLDHGRDGDPWRPVRLSAPARTALAVLVGVLIGAVGWRSLDRPPPRVVPSARPGVSASPSPVLVAEQICARAGPGTLTVSFQLVNAGAAPVRVVAVRPELPLGMLRPTGVSMTGGGGCGRAAQPAGSGPLAAGAAIPVTLTFALLDPCPKPAPVQADVDVAGNAATVLVPLLVDLGQVSFRGC